MKSSDQPESPRSLRFSTRRSGAERPPAPTGYLILRQRQVVADWSEVQEFLGRIPPELAGAPYAVCLLSDKAIRRYNLRFRQKDEATDVLSFPVDRQPASQEPYLGDILISAEMAQRDAKRFGLRLEDEIQALILHGLLHLRGEDHETDNGQMARSERRWRVRLGLPQTLLSRSRNGARRARGIPNQKYSRYGQMR